ncbi:MAG: PD-(D/E)XK nuclease domain-containing protein [Clostridia bacterium]|nr:PD-(D/E)XK nuclease domain-containing protein [Clostridia bacterium]
MINDYFSKTEASSGRGRADVVFEPRKGKDVIPMIMEFKVDDTPDAAISQIKKNGYDKYFAEYTGEILLLGITYDSKSTKHFVKKEIIRVENYKML